MPGRRILIVAAHPDDEVLGCGGTIKKLSHQGERVYVAILGEGITSRYSKREKADFSQVESLRHSAHKVAQILGIQELFFYDLPDNRFDSIPLLDVVKMVEEIVAQVRPQVIYTHHGGDLNIDHVVTYRAVLTATRPMAGQSVEELYAFEIPSSTEWTFQRLEPIFRPNVFVDISSTLENKLQAISYYDSEARKFPHPRSPEALGAIAQRWGSIAGFQAAEAFELIRALK
ncbi:MAG: PIG-L deacetylase family protein [Bacteroidia bacterium]